MYKVIKRDCPMFGIGPYLCEYVCDTTSDISTLPTFSSEGTGGRTAYDNQKCASGSRAIVAENGSESKQYMLNNQDIWCPYSIAAGSSSGGSSESSITVDFALSETSENPVANKTITAALNNKAATTHTHTADDVGADASGSAASALKKAKAYTDSEIYILNEALNNKADVSDLPDLSAYAKKTEVPNIMVNAAVDARTVSGHFVKSDVPANAVFTDTVPDLTPYAKKTDVPGIKVNEAVNADTVGGKSADDFAQLTYLGENQIDTKTAVGTPTKTAIYHCVNWTDYPAESPDGQGIIIAVNYNGSGIAGTDRMWLTQFFISARTGVVYKRYIGDTSVGRWEDFRDGGNANTVGGKDPGKIFYDNGMSSDLNSATKSGCYCASPDTLNTPLSVWLLVETMNYNNQLIVQKAYTMGDTARTITYVRNYANNAWSNWTEISTTPINSINTENPTE